MDVSRTRIPYSGHSWYKGIIKFDLNCTKALWCMTYKQFNNNQLQNTDQKKMISGKRGLSRRCIITQLIINDENINDSNKIPNILSNFFDNVSYVKLDFSMLTIQ